MHVTQATKALYANCHLSIWCDRQQLPQASFQHRHDHPTQASPINVTVLYLQEGGMSPETVQTSELSVDCFTTKLYLDCHNDGVWGIRPAKVCEASKLQSLFGASRLKASKPQSCKASLAPHDSKPQSCKASLAPHASKPQSCKASLALHASKPQSCKASFALHASKPQSCKDAWMLWRFGALALWRLAAL